MATPEGPIGEDADRRVADLLESPQLAQALETEEFKVFLDYVPIAILISRMRGDERRIVYANRAYEALTGQSLEDAKGKGWSLLSAFVREDDPNTTLPEALLETDDFIGCFKREQPKLTLVEAYAAVIENEDAGKAYHITALIDVTERESAQREEFARRLRDKDMLLKELQHRVKNNLQLVTALIRLDARTKHSSDTAHLDRLASRIESLQLLYQDLTADGFGQTIDLGHYLSQIASAVMHAYAVPGIRLDMKVDHAPTSVNVAMPVGLLVNELLTNAFKHAFAGREGGTITLRCLHETAGDYRVVVADDGVGLPEDITWPVPGKIGSLILQALQENAKTDFRVERATGSGTRVTIAFQHQVKVQPSN